MVKILHAKYMSYCVCYSKKLINAFPRKKRNTLADASSREKGNYINRNRGIKENSHTITLFIRTNQSFSKIFTRNMDDVMFFFLREIIGSSNKSNFFAPKKICSLENST